MKKEELKVGKFGWWAWETELAKANNPFVVTYVGEDGFRVRFIDETDETELRYERSVHDGGGSVLAQMRMRDKKEVKEHFKGVRARLNSEKSRVVRNFNRDLDKVRAALRSLDN